jgi:microcystin-dependent protein
MSDAFIGEIRMFGGDYAPDGWMPCDGRTLAIASYSVLYTLIGTTYGGDGQQTFKVPDLRGRAPIHQGQGSPSAYQLGTTGGAETVRLALNEMPTHAHTLAVASGSGTTIDPEGNVLAGGGSGSGGAVTGAGGSDLHENRMPYLIMSYIICCDGSFPGRP